MNDAAAFSPVVVAPTYNNHRTVLDILQRVAALKLPLVVVNDGSTDDTAKLLEKWLGEHSGVVARVVTHVRNRGKATALLSGFSAARAAGYTHAVSIDTDGQLDPEQIPALLEAAERFPRAFVLGYRDDTAADYPARSRVGRRLSNMLIRLESGARVQDSQCGMRVYPLELVERVRCRAGYFGFEAEIITRAAWAGCPITEVPVNCRYLPPGQRVSHFKPWRDSLRGIAMHLRLVMRAMTPLPRHPRWPAECHRHAPSTWNGRSVIEWISPIRCWRLMNGDEAGQSTIAAGLAVGVFIANLPIYGLQTLLSLYTARRLHLHPLSVLAGSHLSTPPLGPLLVVLAISLGHLILNGTLPTVASYDMTQMSLRAVVGPLLLQWCIGGVLLGIVLSVITFVLSMVAMRLIAAQDEATASTSAPAVHAAIPSNARSI